MKLLAHKTLGNGSKKVILLHDLMGDINNYNDIYSYLNIQDFTYIFVDLRGYGESKNILGEYSAKEASLDILFLIKKLNLQNVYLLAHSMSTIIAQRLAIDAKEYIKKLILITPIIASGFNLSIKAKNKLLDEMQTNEKNLENIVRFSSKRYNETWIQNRIKCAQNSSLKNARVAYMKMYLDSDFTEEAKDIKIPIKIIVGKHDFPIFSLKTVKKLFKEVYEDLEIKECLEAGHYPMLECPVYFASTIEDFCN